MSKENNVKPPPGQIPEYAPELTVTVISSNPPFKDGCDRITTVTLKALSDHVSDFHILTAEKFKMLNL